jgi:DNA-binding Xre family transcriptional regulator
METENLIGISISTLLAEKYGMTRQGVSRILKNKNKSVTIEGLKVKKDLEDIREILERTTTITV